MAAGKKKVPAYLREPDPAKVAKAAANPDPKKKPKTPVMRGGYLSWRFSSADKAGPFAWTKIAGPADYKNVMEALHQFETMDESAIAAAGSHAVAVSGCCKDARDRLIELEIDDIDELFSFRLSGKNRVWCRMAGSTMSVLWWDPEHQVYPSQKKHT